MKDLADLLTRHLSLISFLSVSRVILKSAKFKKSFRSMLVSVVNLTASKATNALFKLSVNEVV